MSSRPQDFLDEARAWREQHFYSDHGRTCSALAFHSDLDFAIAQLLAKIRDRGAEDGCRKTAEAVRLMREELKPLMEKIANAANASGADGAKGAAE